MVTRNSSKGVNFLAVEFPKASSPKPARIPPPTPPAGGKRAEAGRIHSPRQIVSPCLVRISRFNRLDSARNSFELCPINTAKIENRNRKPKLGRHEVPTQMHSPPPNPESKRVFHAPRGSKSTVRSWVNIHGRTPADVYCFYDGKGGP